MLMDHWWCTWPIGVRIQHGVETVAKVNEMPMNGLAWQYVIIREVNDDEDFG